VAYLFLVRRMKHAMVIAALFCALVALDHVSARLMQDWTYQELFAKSDLVAIAKPVTATRDTNEQSLLADISPSEPVIGVTTEFESLLMLKGQKQDRFVLHHYRRKSNEPVVNGPMLVSFDPANDRKSYLVFLIREHDGRFAPVAGQTDPGAFSVQELSLTVH
jgi:hypothetical protein